MSESNDDRGSFPFFILQIILKCIFDCIELWLFIRKHAALNKMKQDSILVRVTPELTDVDIILFVRFENNLGDDPKVVSSALMWTRQVEPSTLQYGGNQDPP